MAARSAARRARPSRAAAARRGAFALKTPAPAARRSTSSRRRGCGRRARRLGLVPRRAAVELAPRRVGAPPCAWHTSSKPRGIRAASTAAYAPSTSAPAPATTIERIGTAARFAPWARSAATTSCAADESATSSGVSPQPPRFCGSAPAASSARAPTAGLFDAIRWSGVIPYVSSASMSPPRAARRGRALVVAAHAAHVERLRAARRDVVHQVGPLVEEGGHRGVVAERAVDRRVAAPRVHRAGARVVVLVLAADDDGSARVALDDAAVDARAHRVAVRVEALGVRLADRAVLLGHARREGIVGDAHAVGTVVLAAHRRRGHQDALEHARQAFHAMATPSNEQGSRREMARRR